MKGDVCLLLATILLIAGMANAQEPEWNGKGEYLMRACDVATDASARQLQSDADAVSKPMMAGYCHGLTRGAYWSIDSTINEGLRQNPNPKIRHKRMACDDWDDMQIMMVVDKFLHDHPERLNEVDYVLALDAMARACKQSGLR